jgi:hypothetical protein
LLVITVIRCTRERQKTRSQITYQITTKDNIFRIFNKKSIIITYFILNVYLKNIDKNDKIKKRSQASYSRLATTIPNPHGTDAGQ